MAIVMSSYSVQSKKYDTESLCHVEIGKKHDYILLYIFCIIMLQFCDNLMTFPLLYGATCNNLKKTDLQYIDTRFS